MPRQPGLPKGAIGNGGVHVLDAVMRGAVSHDEIMATTGLSRTTVHYWVKLLLDEGMLVREEGRQNTLRPAVEVVAQIHR